MYNTLFLKEKNYVLVALEDNLELNFFLALLKMHCLALYRSSMYAIGYYPGNSVIEEHMHSLRHAVYIAARSNLFERCGVASERMTFRRVSCWSLLGFYVGIKKPPMRRFGDD